MYNEWYDPQNKLKIKTHIKIEQMKRIEKKQYILKSHILFVFNCHRRRSDVQYRALFKRRIMLYFEMAIDGN